MIGRPSVLGPTSSLRWIAIQAELQANQTALQALANAPTRNWPVIGALASSVRGILEGAGGGVLAAQALGWLATLSGS